MTLRERKEPAPQQQYQVLEPVDQTHAGRRRKMRRQLIIDQQIGIDAETMRSQLRDHTDICGQLVMAPPVEKILRGKEETNPEKLFNLPVTKIHLGLHQTCFSANCRTDLPACAILRQEEANVESFSEEIGRRQSNRFIEHQSMNQHDSDDDDMYSGYAGPPSVASSYHQDDMNQEMSHVDHHQISHQDDQWAKATGQDISGLSFNNSHQMSHMGPGSIPPSPMGGLSHGSHSMPPSPMPHGSMPPSPMPHSMMSHQLPVSSPAPASGLMTPHQMIPSPMPTMSPHPPAQIPASPMIPSAPPTPHYEQPIPSPAQSSAPPTPHPIESPEENLESFQNPPTPIQPIHQENLNESINYEPEPKRLRTESAEMELRDVEAGKGTAACIKYTQRLLQDNGAVSLHAMTEGNNRKIASQKFYSLLVMLKHEHINAVQEEPYADIQISKGINFGGVIMDHC